MNRKSLWVCVALAIGCGSQAGTQSGQSEVPSTAGTQATPSAPAPQQPAAAGMKAAAPTVPARSQTAGSSTSTAAAGSPAETPAAGSGGTNADKEVAGGNAPEPTAGSGGASADVDPVGPAFPAVTDFTSNGPYESVTAKAMGPSTSFTVYHPKELAPGGAKNPIVGWMSGGGTDHTLYPLLPLLATHGFVVVAPDVIPGIGEEANLGKQIIEGIDWAIAENAREGSTFFEKLDTSKLASAGYSMGSLATFQIAADERLTTTVHISGGNMAPEPIRNLRAPAAFLCGIATPDCGDILSSACDIAAANCDVDFTSATTPVFYANFSSGHLGILTPPFQEQIQTEVVAWLRWQLMGDASIKPRFVGEQCGVCMDERWKVQQKNLN
jgi:dienelactone hydrolase